MRPQCPSTACFVIGFDRQSVQVTRRRDIGESRRTFKKRRFVTAFVFSVRAPRKKPGPAPAGLGKWCDKDTRAKKRVILSRADGEDLAGAQALPRQITHLRHVTCAF